MNHYYMKMRELKNRLAIEGYSITERMIKHYIDIGILDKPYYKHVNQALYGDEHYVRLKRILSEKKNGKTISKIKNEILSENEILLKEAKESNISLAEFAYNTGVYKREEADLIKKLINSGKTFNKLEVLELLDCESAILDLSVDSGIVDDKEEYSGADLYVLVCVRNLIQIKKQNHKISGQLIERISEISKIGAAAKQLAALICKDEQNSWVFSLLSEAAILKSVSEIMQEKGYLGKVEFGGNILLFDNNIDESDMFNKE